jgi:hypothetical protein
MNQEFMDLFIQKLQIETFQMIFSKDTFKVIKTLKSNSYNEEGKFYRGYAYFS